jgi:hypothetical protein
MSETKLQIAVAKHLDAIRVHGKPLLWNHCPNEGKRRGKTGNILKAKGMKEGVPDVQIYTPPLCSSMFVPPDCIATCDRRRRWPASGLAIELKVGKGETSGEQDEWIAGLRECGWRVEVCRTLDEVRAVVRACYGVG